MDKLTNLSGSLEELIYEVFVWFMLLPKTLTKVLVNPRWTVNYVEEQLAIPEANSKTKFNEYLSPILFWLLLVGITGAFYWKYSLMAIESTPEIQSVAQTDSETNGYLQKILSLMKTPEFQKASMGFNLIYILSFSIIIQWLGNWGISRSSVRKNIYVQFYCFAPVQFMGIVLSIYDVSASMGQGVAQTALAAETDGPHTAQVVLYALLAASYLWFLIAEGIVISETLKKNWVHSVGVIVLSGLLGIVILIALVIIVAPFAFDFLLNFLSQPTSPTQGAQ